MVGPTEQRSEASYLVSKYEASNVRVCALLGLPPTTFYYRQKIQDEESLRALLRRLAHSHRRFGRPRLFVLSRREGVTVNHKKFQRLYQELNLQLSHRKRKKLGYIHNRNQVTRASHPNHIWAMDFMFDYVESGRRLKIFNIVDEYSKISPGVLVDYSIKGSDVVHFLDQVSQEQPPKIIRVDQGTEFTSCALLNWSYKKGIEIQFTKVRKPNQVAEAYNSRLRDECLNEEVFFSLADAREKIDEWHWKHNHYSPHSALGMKTPMEFVKEYENVLVN